MFKKVENMIKIRVYYEDTDVGGVVYYANYLKFCERARSELFFQKGLSPYNESGHFVVKKLCADYKGSAHLGDLLEVSVRLRQVRAASLVLFQEVHREGELLFSMEVTLAHLSKDQQVKKMTDEEISLIKEIFGTSDLHQD